MLEICRARSGFCRDMRGLKTHIKHQGSLFGILMLELMVVHIAAYSKGLPSMETNYSMFVGDAPSRLSQKKQTVEFSICTRCTCARRKAGLLSCISLEGNVLPMASSLQ